MKINEMTVDRVINAINFIETHLQKDISVDDIAQHACFSLFHFIRVFNQMTRLSPYDYLIRRRLSESLNDLIHSKKKIIEIAFKYQFQSPEVFTRAFKKVMGCLPSEYRLHPVLYHGMFQITKKHIYALQMHPIAFPEITEKANIILRGKQISCRPTQLIEFFKKKMNKNVSECIIRTEQNRCSVFIGESVERADPRLDTYYYILPNLRLLEFIIEDNNEFFSSLLDYCDLFYHLYCEGEMSLTGYCINLYQDKKKGRELLFIQ